MEPIVQPIMQPNLQPVVLWRTGIAGIDYPIYYIDPYDETQTLYTINPNSSTISDSPNCPNSPNSANSPARRSYLNDCLTEIYMFKKTQQPIMEFTVDFNKTRIQSMLNELVLPERAKTFKEAAIERVKRQLFRKPQTLRKSHKPTKNGSVKETQGFHFKAIRHLLGERRLHRDYLKKARSNIIEGVTITSPKPRFVYDEFVSTFNGEDADSHDKTFTQICEFHWKKEREFELISGVTWNKCLKMVRAERAKRKIDHVRFVNEKALEETVRSVYYLRKLLTLTAEGGSSVPEYVVDTNNDDL